MEQNLNLSDSNLTFPVIKKRKQKITISQGIMLSVILVLILYLIFYKTQLNEELSNNIISAILFILFIIIAFGFNFLVQKFKFGGEFTITNDQIILTTTNKTATFKLNEISNLKIRSTSKEQNVNAMQSIKKWLFGKSDEKGNFVEFIHKGDHHIIEIYLKNNLESELLIKRAKELHAE